MYIMWISCAKSVENFLSLLQRGIKIIDTMPFGKKAPDIKQN